MSTDSVSEPPSSAVSHSSYGEDSFTTGSGATSAGTFSSQGSSMDFSFFSPYTVFRGSGNNAFWHHSSNGGAERSPQSFVHPLMLPDAETADSHGHGHGGHGRGMDFLHPPMMHPQEEESLFATICIRL